jgi:hypothetical protein
VWLSAGVDDSRGLGETSVTFELRSDTSVTLNYGAIHQLPLNYGAIQLSTLTVPGRFISILLNYFFRALFFQSSFI